MKTKLFLLSSALLICLAVNETASAGSINLLNRISYVPAERNQGACGDCWVWASTGVMEIARNVQSIGSDRLSIQFLNSCKIDKYACFGGTADMFRTWYQDTAGYAIPWSNTNASFQDATQSNNQQQSNVSCDSIAKSPNYPVGSTIGLTQLTTSGGVGQATAIANIKSVLSSNRAVWMGFFLPNQNSWYGASGFATWFNNNNQSAIWNPDSFCGSTWDSANGAGGHAVIIVGYNDDDPTPANHYWIVLNSWGTANGNRPDGIYHMAMNVNYDCTYDYSGQSVPALIFFDFNYNFPGSATCTYAISPSNQSFGPGSGTGTVIVATQSGCQWTVSGNPSWITITGGASGTGSGQVNYSVAANSGSQARQATLTIAGNSFTVNQNGSSTLPENILSNGDFESGIQDWYESSTGGYEIITNYYPWAHAGNWFAWMGGYDSDSQSADATDSIYQDVTIPVEAASATINFFYQIDTEEDNINDPYPYDTLSVDLIDPGTGNTLQHLVTLSNLDANADWVGSPTYSINNLASLAGKSVRLKFTANMDSSYVTSFLVDDVNLSVAEPLVRIQGVGGYGTFQSAYTNAPMNATIQSQAVELPASPFTLSLGKTILLKGGYDSKYNSNSGYYTTMNGILTLSTGYLTIENLIIK